jgi:hypothetical protein
MIYEYLGTRNAVQEAIVKMMEHGEEVVDLIGEIPRCVVGALDVRKPFSR